LALDSIGERNGEDYLESTQNLVLKQFEF